MGESAHQHCGSLLGPVGLTDVLKKHESLIMRCFWMSWEGMEDLQHWSPCCPASSWGPLQGCRAWLSPAAAASDAQGRNTEAQLQPQDPAHTAILHSWCLATAAMEGACTQKQRHKGSPLSQSCKHVLHNLPEPVFAGLTLLRTSQARAIQTSFTLRWTFPAIAPGYKHTQVQPQESTQGNARQNPWAPSSQGIYLHMDVCVLLLREFTGTKCALK